MVTITSTESNVVIDINVCNFSGTVSLNPIHAMTLIANGAGTTIEDARFTVHTDEGDSVFYDQVSLDPDGVFVIPTAGVVLTASTTYTLYKQLVELIKRTIDNL